jgi:hypothetical protein
MARPGPGPNRRAGSRQPGPGRFAAAGERRLPASLARAAATRARPIATISGSAPLPSSTHWSSDCSPA